MLMKWWVIGDNAFDALESTAGSLAALYVCCCQPLRSDVGMVF